MGKGFRVFQQEAHAAPRALAAEVDPYTHNTVRLFHSTYPGRAWVDNALIEEGDEGLRAEVMVPPCTISRPSHLPFAPNHPFPLAELRHAQARAGETMPGSEERDVEHRARQSSSFRKPG